MGRHALALEYLANRIRKALVVLCFAKAGADGGHEGVPWTEPGDED